MSIISKM
jgi:hypothetical protein